jgi:molecular chaperone GrpE
MKKKNKKEDMRNEEVIPEMETEETKVNSEETEEGDTEAIEENEVDEWKAKFEEINNKYLRLYSEFDNFRKRTSKEKLELYRTAGEDIVVSMLPVLDDFERAMKSISETEDTKSIKEGVNLIYQKLNNTLLLKGLRPLESAIGKEFDLDYQEAISRVPAPEKKMKGKIIDEVEKGYTLNEKVIRFTKVVIGE